MPDQIEAAQRCLRAGLLDVTALPLSPYTEVGMHTPEVLRLLTLATELIAARRTALIQERKPRLNKLLNRSIAKEQATKHIRSANWEVEPIPDTLKDLRCCLIGSANREDLIGGLNSVANVYIADLCNMTPQKSKILYRAHRNINRAVSGTLSRLDEDVKLRVDGSRNTSLIVVPRPMHAVEESVDILGDPVSASIYDIVVHCALNGELLMQKQGAIVFALRRVFCHLEARWFNTLFELIETELGFPRGSIKILLIVDSIEAALELDEMLFEFQIRSLGLTIDPQRYAYSHIQIFSSTDMEVMPDREMIGLDAPFLRDLCLRTVGVAHNRGAHALFPIGFQLHPREIPVPVDGYHQMLDEIKKGIHDGFDGAVVACASALEDVVDQVSFILREQNQISNKRKDPITAESLIARPEGDLSTASLIQMVRTALRYRMAERLDRPWAIQGGRKHDRSSMKLALGILRQWRNSSKGVITHSGLAVDDVLLQYLVEKETKKMFADDPSNYEHAKQEAAYILNWVCNSNQITVG